MKKLLANQDGVNVDGLPIPASVFATLEPNITLVSSGYNAMIYRISNDGSEKEHFRFTMNDDQVAGPLPFPDGDTVLSRKETYRAAMGSVSVSSDAIPDKAQALDMAFVSNPAFRAIISMLADMRNVTPAQVLSKLKTYL